MDFCLRKPSFSRRSSDFSIHAIFVQMKRQLNLPLKIKNPGTIAVLAFCVFFCTSSFLGAQTLKPFQGRESQILTDSHRCLTEIMEIPGKSIPEFLFEKAEGIAVFPGLLRGSFIFGAQHGKGALVIKNDAGQWEAPRFLHLTGGSVGFQAGIQSADVVLVFCSRKSITAVLKGEFTIGADASAAAGPVGRKASASTNVKLNSEMYSYSRSRGLFLGVALDGCVLEIENEISQNYYRNGVSHEARNLVQLVAGYVQSAVNASAAENPNGMEPPASAANPSDSETADPFGAAAQNPTANPASGAPADSAAGTSAASAGTPSGQTSNLPPNEQVIPGMENFTPPKDRESARVQLVSAHGALMEILDPEWQKWLALPPELLTPSNSNPQQLPSTELITLQERLHRLEGDAKYAQLTARPEFTKVKMLLGLYLAQ